jgi:hypothetical protein
MSTGLNSAENLLSSNTGILKTFSINIRIIGRGGWLCSKIKKERGEENPPPEEGT